jgi:rhodanese-related sulfurtransferase
MDGSQLSITPSDLYARLGTARAPTVVDVRRSPDFSAASQLIVGAFHESPDEVDSWKRDLPTGRPVVVHCAHGREVSQGVAATLQAHEVDAAYLEARARNSGAASGPPAWDKSQ